MKKFLFLLTAAIVALSMFAAPVDQAKALKTAKSYLAEMYSGQIMAPAAVNPVLLKAGFAENSKVKKPVYYIFNTSTTYLVVAGDDRAEEILMVGDAPLEDINNLPLGMIDMLGIYAEQIQFLHEHPSVQVEKISGQGQNSLRAVTYGPLLTAKWDQDAPYWNLCKFTYNGKTYQCYTGCPATSAAMVLYYWKYPASVNALASYTSELDIDANNSQGWTAVNYTYPALDATTFDWANMKDSYSTYNSAQASAVATLMRYVGQAEGMMYGVAAAGGSGIYSNENYRIANMFKQFGYKSTARSVYKSSYTATNWNNLIQSELAAGRPLVYCAIASGAGGHAFNVDGWRDSDSKYHVNWGWSGVGNNWFAMDAFKDTDGYTFNQSQQAVIGIEAPDGPSTNPELSVDPTALSFSGEAGQTYTKTFTVTGANLTNNVTLSISDNSVFTISPTTITQAQATAGATVTVTYKPTAAGTKTATVTVASEGASSRMVSLSGTATVNTTPTLVADPNSLSLSTVVGTPVTQTFLLSGTYLQNTVYLTCTGDGFSIDKTVQSKTAVQNGTTITVTYNPTSSGNHTGSINIRSTGAQDITVSLNGTATASPKITVNPTSLSFNATVGETVTKTFNVTGSDLTGIVTLSCSGTGFSIDKTNISMNAATNGATVTVSYHPTTAGNHTGTVTLNSNGAQPVTVSLNGAATAPNPTLTVNPTSLSFSTVAGTPVTKTFTVTGANLTGAVTLSCSGTGFSIDKTNITTAAATNGSTVTVTFNPTAAGNYSGTVTLNSNGAQPVTVALTGAASEPVRTIIATPSALNFTTLVGEVVTNTFNVSGENLTGDLTLTLNDPSGVFNISQTTISAAQAMAGNVPVSVVYEPFAFGTQSATVTISGGGAPAVTVTLNGQADLVKYAPVMLPAIEEYINLTQFRADWTDASPAESVTSYTLEVTPKAVEPEPEPELIASLSGTSYSGTNYYTVTLTAPWEGVNVHGHNNQIVYFRSNYNGDGVLGYISYTVPEGYENATFTMKITSGTDATEAVGNITVSTPQTAAVTHHFNPNETYAWVVTASSGDKIMITTPDDNYSPDMALIEVYSGDATVANLRANETGDQNSRLITGITDKFYTVENLLAEGTFLYRVKALYADGTESDWSNIEEVTLFQNGHGFEPGDVNHDGAITISDVTALINGLLSNEFVCTICADVNEDNSINISDVTALINKLLSGGNQSASLRHARLMGR